MFSKYYKLILVPPIRINVDLVHSIFLFSAFKIGDLQVVNSDPLYAKPNKKSHAQAKHGMQASGSKMRDNNSCKFLNCEERSVVYIYFN